jgi:hypothetical protein
MLRVVHDTNVAVSALLEDVRRLLGGFRRS